MVLTLVRSDSSDKEMRWGNGRLQETRILVRTYTTKLYAKFIYVLICVFLSCAKVLSVLEMQNLTCPTTTFKRLILNTSFTRWDLPGMANLLRNSVSLETLVLNMTRPSGGRGEVGIFTNILPFRYIFVIHILVTSLGFFF